MEGIIEQITDKFGGAFKIGNDWYNFTKNTRDIASKLSKGDRVDFDVFENEKGKKYIKFIRQNIPASPPTSPAPVSDPLFDRITVIFNALDIQNKKLDELTKMVRGLLVASGKEIV